MLRFTLYDIFCSKSFDHCQTFRVTNIAATCPKTEIPHWHILKIGVVESIMGVADAHVDI